MRSRCFAALLIIPLALGACDRNPLGLRADLLGEWQSDVMHVPGTASSGSSDLGYQQHWWFDPNGTYQYAEELINVVTFQRWVLNAERGSWSAGNQELRKVVRERFTAPDVPQPVPVFAPIDPEVQHLEWEITGSELRISIRCIDLCVAPLPVHRIPGPTPF